MMSSRDGPSKEEAGSTPKREGPATKFASTPWFRLKDPRVVRVSRALGGKDRHSKVCTMRGLRDRRVRLSVPTAIQLYDLQDRLGLSQPSKVVDWLLDAAKHEINELPPLPPFNLGQLPHIFNQHSLLEIDQSRLSSSSNRELGLITIGTNNNLEHGDHSRKKLHSNGSDDDEGPRNNRDAKRELRTGQVGDESARNSDNNDANNFNYSSSFYHLMPSNVANYFPQDGPITSHRPSEDQRSFNFVHHAQPEQPGMSLPQTHPYFPLQFITPSGPAAEMVMMSSGLQNFLSSSHHEPPAALISSLSHHHHHTTARSAPVIGFDVNAGGFPGKETIDED